MDGAELFGRTVSTVQEACMKIGDARGSMRLYYPFDGDFESLKSEFMDASSGILDSTVLELMPGRVRITVSEKDSGRILGLPAKESMKRTIELIRDCATTDEFRRSIAAEFPGAEISKSSDIEFDWVMVFPEKEDTDVYCISEELGALTYHRFSAEEYRKLGFEMPRKSGDRWDCKNLVK